VPRRRSGYAGSACRVGGGGSTAGGRIAATDLRGSR
jgi:hypothetical protein